MSAEHLEAAHQAEAARKASADADSSNASSTATRRSWQKASKELDELKQELQIVHQNWMTLVAKLHEDQGAETRSAESRAQHLQHALDLSQQQLEQKSAEHRGSAQDAATALQEKSERPQEGPA